VVSFVLSLQICRFSYALMMRGRGADINIQNALKSGSLGSKCKMGFITHNYFVSFDIARPGTERRIGKVEFNIDNYLYFLDFERWDSTPNFTLHSF